MKKILLASTALVLSAGLANAQAVSIGGQGRMGIQYNSTGFPGGSNYQMEQRLQFNFRVTVQGDHGLSFGAFSRARMQSNNIGIGGFNTANAGVFSGARVWVEANNLRLTFGNVDGAFTEYGIANVDADDCGTGYTGVIGCYSAAGLPNVTTNANSSGPAPGQTFRMTYSQGETHVSVSHVRAGATELGLTTTFDAFTLGLGYTNGTGYTAADLAGTGFTPGQAVTALSGWYNGGSWALGAIVAGDSNITNWSITANTDLAGGSLNGFFGSLAGNNVYGVNYDYGLGGGASLRAGIEGGAGGTATHGSIGVVFGF